MTDKNSELREQEKELADRYGLSAERVSEIGTFVALLLDRLLKNEAERNAPDRIDNEWSGLGAVVAAWPNLPPAVKEQIKKLIERSTR